MAKKVLFVNGPSQDPSDRFFGWPTPLLYAIAPSVDAINKGHLNLEYDPKIFEPLWYVEGENDTKIKEDFRKRSEDVDIICASAIYDSLYPTLQLFQEAKKQNPRVVTILGGPHFDEVHNLSSGSEVSSGPLVDFAVAGDGEYALKSILESVVQGDVSTINMSNVKGKSWIYHNGKEYSSDGSNPLVLDDLPFMPVDLVDVERHKNDIDVFRSESDEILPAVQILAMRGCPYSCGFCSERKDLAYPNSRSIDSLLEELELRKSQGFQAAFFDDSTFGAYKSNQGDVNELLGALSGTGMKFGSLNRFNLLQTSEKIQPYVDGGFSYMYCAIEQFDDNALQEMGKGQKKAQIDNSMNLLSQHGMNVGVSLLYGFDFETPRSIEATLDYTANWAREGTVVLASESVLCYHPGTPMGAGKNLEFNRTPPNKGHPFNRFEEGQWYHPEHVTADYLNNILELSEQKFGDVLVRNRHSWNAKQGNVLTRKN